ncbi:MAG: class I SAM-dependent methyltransferase [Gaiellaceae bacterium]
MVRARAGRNAAGRVRARDRPPAAREGQRAPARRRLRRRPARRRVRTARLGVTGVDVSEDQLRLARSRGVEVVLADAEELPFDDASFDAAVSMWTHTDVGDVAAVLREIARVLRPGAPFVYQGAHPCFVGPHSRFVSAEGVPTLHPGYWQTGRYHDAPGISPHGLRAKVGAVHLPLGLLVQAFLDAGLRLEQFEEPQLREYPWMIALRARR